jgi:hypothetical protein
MIYKFRSDATGDLIMLGPVGDQMLRIIGKEPSAKGIIEAPALAAAIAALEQAVAADEGVRARGRTTDEDDAGDEGRSGGDRVSLRQRAWPLIEMMRRAQREQADIVWGV